MVLQFNFDLASFLNKRLRAYFEKAAMSRTGLREDAPGGLVVVIDQISNRSGMLTEIVLRLL